MQGDSNMNDLKVNGAGYYDPTAYAALSNIQRKEVKGMELYNGDILEYEKSNGSSCEVVILAVHDKYSTIISLSDSDKLPYSVKCRGMRYTDPGMIQYAYNNKLSNYIRSMTDQEYVELMDAVVDSLGYEAKTVEVAKKDDASASVPALSIPASEIEGCALTAGDERKKTEEAPYIAEVYQNIETEELKESLIKVQAERDVYKELYENLFSRMIEK